MNKPYRPASTTSSALSAAAAFLVAASIFMAIASLADHYVERTQIAGPAAFGHRV